MPTENTGGAQLTVIGTDHTLATITAAGTYQLVVDLDPMALGDIVELRIFVKARSASTSREAFFVAYPHDQGADAVSFSPPVGAPFEFIAKLKQIAGSVHTFDWSIYEY